MKRSLASFQIYFFAILALFFALNSSTGIAQILTCDLGRAQTVLVLKKHLIVSGFISGQILAFDTRTENPRKLREVHPAGLHAFANGGQLVASPTGNRFAAFVGTTDHLIRPQLIQEHFGARLFKITPDGKVGLVPLRFHINLRSYEAADYGGLKFVKARNTPPLLAVTATKLAFSDERSTNTDTADARVIFFNAVNGTRYWTFIDPDSSRPLSRVDFSKNGRLAVIPAHNAGGSPIGVRILDLVTKAQVGFIESAYTDYQVIDGESIRFEELIPAKGKVRIRVIKIK